jgi:hypothetical protein
MARLFASRVVLIVAVGLLAVLAIRSARSQAPPPVEYAWLSALDAHGRPVSLGDYRGQVVALTFASRETRDESTDINDELTELAKPGNMTVLSVVSLESVPGIGMGMARGKIAESDRPGLLHLVDEHGALKGAFHVEPKKDVDIFVIDRDGAVRGHFVGEAGLPAAVRLIKDLKARVGAPHASARSH